MIPHNIQHLDTFHSIEHRAPPKNSDPTWEATVEGPGELYIDKQGRELNLTLQEWDPRTLPEHFFLTLEGKRRTGKSTFAKWLLQYYQDKFSLVWCMTLTKASGYWQEFVGDKFTFDNWNPLAVEKLIQRGDHFIKQFGEDSPEANKLGSSLLILDDVISAKIHNDPTFNRLATEGRHHLISVILMTQDPHAISPKVRDNSDLAVIFNLKTFRNKESIWKDFMNDIDKETAQVLLAKYAINHDALVCVQTNLDGKISKNFFKSTGDKSKLKDPEYLLGSVPQKVMVMKEREERAAKKKKIIEDRAQRGEPKPNDAEKFTIENILKSTQN